MDDGRSKNVFDKFIINFILIFVKRCVGNLSNFLEAVSPF